MKKVFIIILSMLFLTTPAFAEAKKLFNYDLEQDINRDTIKAKQEREKARAEEQANNKNSERSNKNYSGNKSDNSSSSNYNAWEHQMSVYPDATIKSAITKYKRGNYSGSLQELISLTKKDPGNPLIYYYLGMAYTQVGNKEQAINAYDKVLKLHPNYTLTTYATKGKDCLTGGPTCVESNSNQDELDKFVNAPYGNGLSDELNQQQRDLQLKNLQKKINAKELNEEDIENIQKLDRQSDAVKPNEKVADVSNEDVLAAVETLKKAGVTVSINPYQTQLPMNDEYAQLSMMLGSNNNNNNSMMNMLPMLMAQNNGKNIDPQILQSMMMNSMIPDFTFNDKKDY